MSHAYSMKRRREGEEAGNVAENHIAFGDHGDATRLSPFETFHSYRSRYSVQRINILFSFFFYYLIFI